jgi:hypothetical protein
MMRAEVLDEPQLEFGGGSGHVDPRGQIAVSSRQLRALGARVAHALCVIDRQEGGEQALATEGITLRALLTRADLDEAAAG